MKLWHKALLALAISAVAVWLVQSFLVGIYKIPSESMSPTLRTGDRVLVLREALAPQPLKTGDIAVFERPASWESANQSETLVKRVIAGPGQTVSCCDVAGHIEVDGKPLTENYLQNDFLFVPGALDCSTAQISPRCFDPVTVPDDSYLVLGDNRTNSVDSLWNCRQGHSQTCARFVPSSDIRGRVWLIAWPLNRISVPASG